MEAGFLMREFFKIQDVGLMKLSNRIRKCHDEKSGTTSQTNLYLPETDEGKDLCFL